MPNLATFARKSAYFEVINVGWFVKSMGEFWGKSRNMRKKAAMWTTYPSTIMGSLPCAFVFFPSSPNRAPPEIVLGSRT